MVGGVVVLDVAFRSSGLGLLSGCCFSVSVGEFASGCRQDLQLAYKSPTP